MARTYKAYDLKGLDPTKKYVSQKDLKKKRKKERQNKKKNRSK